MQRRKGGYSNILSKKKGVRKGDDDDGFALIKQWKRERRECLSDRRKMAMRGVISNTCNFKFIGD